MNRFFAGCFVAAIVLTGSSASAGQFSGGLKAGVNRATLTGDEAEVANAEPINGFILGGYFRIGLNDHFSIQPELLLSRNGAKGDTLKVNGTVRINYFEVPLLARYRFNPGRQVVFDLFLGPAISKQLSADAEIESGGTTETVGLDTIVSGTDKSIILGGELGLSVGRPQITVEVRYKIGFSTIDGSRNGSDIRNRVFSVLLGVFFGWGEQGD